MSPIWPERGPTSSQVRQIGAPSFLLYVLETVKGKDLDGQVELEQP